MNNREIRLPPQNIEFEESVISGCLLFPEICEDVTDVLIPEDFYRTAHQKIYKAILDLKLERLPIDLLTVTEKLRFLKMLEEIGGASHLAEIVGQSPVPIDTQYAIKKIRECSELRKTIEICNKTAHSCYDFSEEPEGIIDRFQTNALSLDINTKSESYVSLKQLVLDGDERHRLVYENTSAITGVGSGFKDIDTATCGFQKGDLIILAARPSMGKSALMRSMSVNMAKQKHPNLIISLEMSKEQIYDTMISSESNINSSKFRNGMFSQDDWGRKADAASSLYELNCFVIDRDCFKLLDICKIARQLKKKENVQAVFIDYLQLIEGDATKTKNYEIGEITRRLKQLAKELDIPLVLLSQLNRKCDERTDKRPILSDLRDSGSIEQDADIIIFLYRHEEYIKNKYDEDGNMTEEMKKWKGIAEANIAKQRMGPTRIINLVWLKKTVTFQTKQRGEYATTSTTNG